MCANHSAATAEQLALFPDLPEGGARDGRHSASESFVVRVLKRLGWYLEMVEHDNAI